MNFVRHGQLFATLSTTGCQYATTVGSLHTLTKTMLVISLSVVGLECSFHFCYAVFLFLIYISLSEKGQHLPLLQTSRPRFPLRHLLTSGCKGRKTFVIEQKTYALFTHLQTFRLVIGALQCLYHHFPMPSHLLILQKSALLVRL